MVPLKAVCAIAAISTLFALTPMVFDMEQCNRACRQRILGKPPYNMDTKIRGTWQLEDTCVCRDTKIGKTLGSVARKFPSVLPGYPYLWRNEHVCGVDGVEYESKVAAHAANTSVINCGSCGSCSNEHDIGIMKNLGDQLVSKVAPCVVTLMFGTKFMEEFCLKNHVGFSEECAECWAQDHLCMLSHCFYSCVLNMEPWMNFGSRWKGGNEEIQGCLHCMEIKCSKPFIDSCGANRRLAGIHSEIDRDPKEICNSSDFFSRYVQIAAFASSIGAKAWCKRFLISSS